MATVALKAKLTLNKSAFSSGMKAAKGEALAFGNSIGNALKSAVTSPLAAIGGLLAGAFSVGKFVEGVKGALDMGEAMENLKARTGESVDNLLIFQQVLKANGVDASETGDIINKMQRTISEATYSSDAAYKSFGMWGISIKDLIKLSPVAQFRAIEDALRKIPSASGRAAAAVAIFGRGQGKLLGAHFDAKGFEDAQKALGRQAQVLAANSHEFGVVAERLNRAGMKIQGFFIGATSTLLPALMKFSGILDAADLEHAGEAFGRSIETAVEVVVGAFQHPEKLLSAFANYMGYVFLRNLNELANGFIYAAKVLAGALMTGFGEAIAFLGAGIEWALLRGVDLFNGGMGDAVKDMGNAILDGFKAGVVFLRDGIKAAWDWSVDAIPKAFAAAKEAMAPKGPVKAGEGFSDILGRWQKSDMIAMGKQLMGANLGHEDFFGAEKFKNASKEAIEAMRKAGEEYLRLQNTVVGEKTGFLSDSSLTRQYHGVNGASMAMSAADWAEFRSPGNIGQPVSGWGSSVLNFDPYGKTPLLNARERRGFEDSAVARGENRSSSAGAFGAIRSGDTKRRKDFEKSEARKAAGVDRTNQLLEGMSGDVSGINKAFVGP